MATTISTIETLARQRLIETTARFWTSSELTDIIAAGVRDLWRDIVDLKGEHYLTINNTDVTFQASSSTLQGVPADVHKIYLLEALDGGDTGSNTGLTFTPLDYNHKFFQAARAMAAVDPANTTLYYAITSQGAPVGAPIIRVAPQVTTAVSVSFCYVPTLGLLTTNSVVPVPGEADNALVAWCVAFARAKEREDRSPDANWLAVYATEKQHLLQSLGIRQYQEPTYVDAIFEEYWG